MLAAITGFLAALPQLLSMIQSLMGWLTKVSGNDPAGFINKAGSAFDQLSQAETSEEHAAAAKAIADLLAGMAPK